MATKIWRGDAPAVAQVDTLTPGGTIEVGDRFKVTINGKTVSYSATGTTVASVCTGLAAALNALDSEVYPEFAEITWADATTAVTGTAKTKGKLHTITVATTESDDSAADLQTFTKTATTASSGPYHWDTAANWSSSGVPATGDDVYLENSDVDILYGLDQNAVDLTSLTIKQSYTGKIGLPLINADGDASYYEYRQKDLKVGFTALSIGQGEGAGSPFLNINGDTTVFTASIYNTGQSEDANRAALRLLGGNTSNVLHVIKGSVDYAYQSDDSGVSLGTLNVSFRDNVAGDSTVRVGSAVAPLTAVNIRGGVVEMNSNAVTITQTDGELSLNGTMTVTTHNFDGGTCYDRSSGTVTTVNVGDGAVLDYRRDTRSKTVSTINVFAGATVLDPYQRVTFTNNIDLERCALADVTLDLGTHIKLTRGTPT
jgi:hypothetical protein